MSSTPPGVRILEEESTENHWVGSCREVAMIFAYEGSHDDVGHVHAGGRVMERLGKELGPTIKMLFVLPPLHGKPPSARVRSALAAAARRVEPYVSRVAIVVGGTGFGAAVHRGAATGLIAILRPKVPIEVFASAREGVAFLIGEAHPARDALVAHCEERMRGPSCSR